jgi:hypothetical protein
MAHDTDMDTGRQAWGKAVGVAVALSAVIVTVLLAFLWPIVTASPKDVPIGISGPAAIVQQFESQAPDVFALVEVQDRGAAVAAIESRQLYGALLLDPTGPEVLVSSAASPLIAQQLRAVAPVLQQQFNAAAAAQAQIGASGALPAILVDVTDVVPLASTDQRGAGLAASSFPLIIGGLLGGVVIALVVAGAWRRLVSVVVYSGVAGFAITAVMQPWLGILQADYLVNSLAVGLALLAIAAPIVGLASLLGRPGAALGAVLFLLGANPISAAAQPPEFLLAPWGAIGQWFPPGAAGTLLRDLSYFPAADASFPWLVLGAWALGGLVLTALGSLRDRRVVPDSVSRTPIADPNPFPEPNPVP